MILSHTKVSRLGIPILSDGSILALPGLDARLRDVYQWILGSMIQDLRLLVWIRIPDLEQLRLGGFPPVVSYRHFLIVVSLSSF